MKEKYINDCIIGNTSILVSISKKGQILRYFAPTIDYMQHIDESLLGLIIDSKLYWLNNERFFQYEQNFELDANILFTKYISKNIIIEQRDFVDINNDVLVRTFKVLKNEKNSNLKLLVYNDKNGSLIRFISGQYNKDYDYLTQYIKDSYFTVFSDTVSVGYKVNGTINDAEKLLTNDLEYEGLSKSSYIVYPFEEHILDEEENKTEFKLTIYIGVRENDNLNKVMVQTIKQCNEELMYEDTKKYWLNVVKTANKYEFKNDKEKEIYIRSILLLPLYVDNHTGGCIASCEVDEGVKKCGRYAYCWPRDGMYFMNALKICGLGKIAQLYYSKFLPLTQSSNGMWEQRFYTDGSLAPCWGSQIDQTASAIIGLIEEHNISTNELKIIQEAAIENGIDYLVSSIDNEGLQIDTYDIWENYFGKDQYSLASIYCAFNKYVEGNFDVNKTTTIKELMNKIRQNIFNRFWDDEKQSYVKAKENRVICSSALALVYPFELCDPIDEKMLSTVNAIERHLKTNIGGIKRVEGDSYIGGNNSWVISTLWLSLYYIKKYNITNDINDNIKALEYFDWVTNHASTYEYLPEQVLEKNELWVNGLAWSHAMYLICVEELYGKK